jgi:hypothetical protein
LNDSFTVLNAFRAIPPGNTHSVLIKFNPEKEEEVFIVHHSLIHSVQYTDTLQLFSNSLASKTFIPVIGRGINPTLKIEPSGILSSLVTNGNSYRASSTGGDNLQ